MSIKIKPQFLYDEEGNKMRVILSSTEFDRLMEELADLKSVYTAQMRMSGKKIKLIPFEEVKREFQGDGSKKLS